MITRRKFLDGSVKTAGALAFTPTLGFGQESPMITRAIPSSGESVPVVGLGSSATFSELASDDELSALREVFATMLDHGGRVFDTAPSYGGGASEEAAGQIAEELGLTEDIFWATKLNVAPRGGGPADAEEARAQLEQSFRRIKKSVIDLIQVHNLGDLDTQLPILREYKEEGKIRYLGVTTTFPQQYPELVTLMENEPLDFIGIDYAVDNREVEETILPLAEEREIGVLVYAPFGRTRLWDRVAGRDLPGWAAEFGAESWAQFFIKFALGHPAVTAVTPATSKPHHMADNMGAAYGSLPDAETRERMVEFVENLPEA